jgi:hypothetical protein
VPRLSRPLIAAALAGCLVAGCGDSSKDESSSTRATSAQTAPASTPTDFPSAQGKTLVTLREGLPEGPILAAGVSLLDVGRNRFTFALVDQARKQLTGADVAVYVADREGGNVEGPFKARSESLAVDKRFQSKTTAQDPDAAQSVYVVDLPFRHKGQALVMGLARLDGRLVATSVGQVVIGAREGPPDVGERAISVHTPTLASVKGDASKIDTRVPPARDLLQHDLAEVLGKRPVVLMFATPRLCQSRTCAPVVDVMEQVRSEIGPGPAFIHVEVYKGNDVSKGFLPQLLKWRLPTEPWTFIIDRSGVVRERFEGTLSVAELRRAVKKVA